MKLKDKVVLITGSSSGIGEATALLFAKEGAKVVVNSKSNERGGRSVAEEIKKMGSQATYVKADISDPKSVNNLFRRAIGKFGKLDILINNAGASHGGKTFTETTKKDWIETFDDNFFWNCSLLTNSSKDNEEGWSYIKHKFYQGFV